MANMHVLQAGGGTVTVVMHVAVPAGNNSAGLSWRSALVNSGIGGTTQLRDGDGTLGTISAAEKASIASGAVYETSVELEPERVAPAGLVAWLDAQYAVRAASALLDLQARLKWYGYTRG